MTARIHPTAIIEAGVHIGVDTAVWDHVHIRERAWIGDQCIVGEKAHIAYDVRIGHRVKIGAFVYVCTGVTIEDGVMLAARVTFTNDRYPRAATPDLQHLLSSAPTDRTLATVVRRGATIGAAAVIGPGVEVGAFAMVGMGAVVSRPVAPFHLVVGNPARSIAALCRCGDPFHRFADGGADHTPLTGVPCARCGRGYDIVRGVVREHTAE